MYCAPVTTTDVYIQNASCNHILPPPLLLQPSCQFYTSLSHTDCLAFTAECVQIVTVFL